MKWNGIRWILPVEFQEGQFMSERLICLCCNKKIETNEKRIIILSMNPAQPPSPTNRVTYCTECFLTNASDAAIEGLALDDKNSSEGPPNDFKYIKPLNSEPIECSLHWYCEECHSVLSGIERDAFRDMNKFHCHSCHKVRGSIVYRA
jgi:hypothetical protein